MSITIIDIAKLAGVGTSTVSRFLNGGYVSDVSRKKIEQAITATNYKPNNFAQNLKGKRSNLVGIIVPRLDSFSVSKILNGIDRTLKENDMQMLIHTSGQDLDREIDSLYSLATQKVAGIILLATEISDRHLEAVHKTKRPCILVGQQHSKFSCVIQNDYDAAYAMGKYILSQGHLEIAYFGVSHKDEAVGIRRKQGFLQAMEDHGLSNIPFVETSFSIEDAEQQAIDFLTHTSEMNQRPTVIACATDNIALGVMKAANRLQIQIPTELSISGFGGYDVSQIVQPNLTTIKYDYEATGVQAASSLIQQVEGQEQAPPQLHVMNYELFIKESVDNKNLYVRM